MKGGEVGVGVGGEVGGEVGGGVEHVRMQPVCNAFTINPGGQEVHAEALFLEYCPTGHFAQILRARSA
jgi:hypothetical protein